MAPSSQSQINHSDRPRINSSSFSSSSYSCGSSKAQLCLQKILHIILTVPSGPVTILNEPSSENATKDVPTPVFGPPPEMNGPVQISPASPSADKGPAVNAEEKGQAVEEENNPDDDGKQGGGDYMGLLIDAAKLIFGEIKEDADRKQSFDDSNDNDEPIEKPRLDNTIKPKSQSWPVGFYEDMEPEQEPEPEPEPEPVVRSKRGRTQVLPCKYRDSVLEPLTRVSRNHRSRIISSKRKLRSGM